MKETTRFGKLPDNYKLAIFLGYKLSWVLIKDYKWSGEYNGLLYEPKFCINSKRYDWFYHQTWDGLMDVILPKFKEKALITAQIQRGLLDFDKKIVFTEIMKIVDEIVPDVKTDF